MNKWDLISIMREQFNDKELTDMLIYWLSSNELEKCVKDFLKDRDLELTNGYIKSKSQEDIDFENSTDIYRLERHQYAPELNKIHLTNGKIVNAPRITTIEEAEQFLIIKGY